MQNTNKTKEKLQQDALNKFINYYYKEKNTRGILCACCGYGKSYLMYKIIKECILNRAEKLFIIATSRIKLLEQLGPELYKWNNNDKNNWNLQISVFCSENITYDSGQKFEKKINFNIDSNELIKKITIKKNNTVNIILTTYNSAKKIVDEIVTYNKNIEDNESEKDIIEPDLIILDEAHNTVGNAKTKGVLEKFHHELFKTNDYFESSKYLFMTATPLKITHKNPESKINTEETNYSMDNIDIYGKIFYYYTFSEAIQDKIITDFQTIYLEQNKELFITADIKNKLALLTKEEKEKKYFIEISSLLIESMLKYDFKKTIIYISNKYKAELYKQILEKMHTDYKNINNKFNFDIFKVVNGMSEGDKKKEQHKFEKSQRAVLISVNIFNEGIDIPCVDSVMFAEERFSQTVIVQNIGRCLRLDSNNPNKIGFVIIPNILYEIGENNENNIFYSSKFKVIRYCINIIKTKKTKNFMFSKFSDNKNQNNTNEDEDEDENLDEIDEEELKKNEKENNKIISNIQINQNIQHNLNLLKYFKIKGTLDGFISNITLDEIKEKYVIELKINNLKDYGYQIKKDKNDQWLKLDEDYRNDIKWISWQNFFTNKLPPKYNECKKIFDYLRNLNYIIKNLNDLNELTKFIVNHQLEEEYEYNSSSLFGNTSKNIEITEKIICKNKQKYNEIINYILSIPTQPQKFYTSSNEWIDTNDFLGLDENGLVINQTTNLINDDNLNNELKLDNNLKNFLNNDANKIKKSKWNILNIEISEFILDYLKNEIKYDSNNLILEVKYRLNKNDIYDRSYINICKKISKDIIYGKICLDENKIEFNKNISNISNNLNEEDIKLDRINYFDSNFKLKINNFILNIKNIINKNLEKEIKIKNDTEDKIKKDINIVINNNHQKDIININKEIELINNELSYVQKNNNIYDKSDNLNHFNKNIYDYKNYINNKNIDDMIKEYNSYIDDGFNYEKDKLKKNIQKYYPNFGNVWTNEDKKLLVEEIKKNNNLNLIDFMNITGRNEGGIIIQLRKFIEQNIIDINNLSNEIKILMEKDNKKKKFINLNKNNYSKNFNNYRF